MARIESKLAALGLVLPAPLKAPPGVVLPFAATVRSTPTARSPSRSARWAAT
jgi:hypothetical protein